MKLSSLFIQGFKSIDSTQGARIPLGDVTVLLGANGSGKSSVVSFFQMLNAIMSGTLQQYVAKYGVNSLLFYGSKKTQEIAFELGFDSTQEGSPFAYDARLALAYPEKLVFLDEQISLISHQLGEAQPAYRLTPEAYESTLKQSDQPGAQTVFAHLANIRTYQFQDTSDTARIKDRSYVDDAHFLRADAGNLAAFLKMLKEHAQYRKYYDKIVRHIQRIMPQFGDFVLDSVPGNQDYVRLNWRDNSLNDYLFSPHQISDGSLRFMALTTLLLQPPELMPKFIVLDEPELGLHPVAINELAAMIQQASIKTQILLATQSPQLASCFDLEDLVIVERDPATLSSVFIKHSREALSDWLQAYSLAELWEKNVLGGQP